MAGIDIGKFQIVGTLGKGAHSTILHIRRQADSRHYALKVVPIHGSQDQKFLEQAQHEFKVAQKLDHPSLIKIFALETQRDWLFRVRRLHLLVEYINGQTLDTFKAIPMRHLVQIFQQVAAGLAHMHRRNVYHADLKPNNIMLSRAGEVKVLDFGLAWIKGEDKGRVQGTPEYMAPETARKGTVNERTDIYNLGATMYRLVTFRFPPCAVVAEGGLHPEAKTWERMIKPVRECNAEVPPSLADLIHACLAFEPVKRPERMTHIKDELDDLVEELVREPEDQLDAFEW